MKAIHVLNQVVEEIHKFFFSIELLYVRSIYPTRQSKRNRCTVAWLSAICYYLELQSGMLIYLAGADARCAIFVLPHSCCVVTPATTVLNYKATLALR